MRKIYLDYAATTPVLPEVIEAMKPYWTEKFGNASSLHSFGREARMAVEESRANVAKILNCEPEEIIFTGTTTTSDNLAILGVALAAQSQRNKTDKGDKGEKLHLITTQIEHHAVLDTFKYLERVGFEVTYLPVDGDGLVKLDELDQLVRPETVLISVMYANNEVGTIQSLSEISSKIKNQKSKLGTKIYFHSDAAAAAEYLDLDVKKLGVDLMTLGSHKFGGPKGVGILYVKKGTEISPITVGGHHEGGLWPGTEPTPLIIGMAKALELAQFKVQKPALSLSKGSKFKVTELRDKLIKGVLEKVEGSILTGHPTQRLADIASFVFKRVEGEAILLRLDAEGIAVSSGSACTSGDLKPSHVLLAMGIPQEEAHGSIRFSLGRNTTEEEIDYVLEVLPRVIEELRGMTPKL